MNKNSGSTGAWGLAQVCADGGNVQRAIEIVLDVEQLTCEAGNMLNAATILNRHTVGMRHCRESASAMIGKATGLPRGGFSECAFTKFNL